jgi:hypothetical protein
MVLLVIGNLLVLMECDREAAERAYRWRRWRGARVTHWNRTLARTPRIQPMIAATRTSQTSETRELPTSQSTWTREVFVATSATNTAISTTTTIA